ncbi:splicing factor 3B subunit 2 [Syngnathus acus]|uniref:splicing factor 3B subunit 2 n=1 Tax=Syngnathus acus TaxID=161584 RepID=UPI00188633B9|nr:splicing factor 3B subunit 2 [Syngnathus acus]
MASDQPPGSDAHQNDLGIAIAGLNSWTHRELQVKLAELGMPVMGPREELMERCKNYMIQTGILFGKVHDDNGMGSQMPPGMGGMMHPAMGMMPAGMHMAMEGSSLPPPGLSHDDHLHMAQHRAAMMMHEEHDSRVMDDQDLLEQQNRAAMLLEQERHHPVTAVQIPLDAHGALPPGIAMLAQRHRLPPPPPGEDNREAWQGDDIIIGGPKIPQALEKILQLKEIRQEQHIDPAEAAEDDGHLGGSNSALGALEAGDDDSRMSKKDKNRRRRNRKKKSKNKRAQEKKEKGEGKDGGSDKEDEPEVEIEYVTEEPDIYDSGYIIFKRIFDAFKLTDDLKKEKEKEPEKAEKQEIGFLRKKAFELERKDSDDSDEDVRHDQPKLSKKKLRRMNRLTVAELKQLVARPDVVEMHDVTAQEPKLLVHLKATRNTVPVPRHWCFKRKYLQGKRGIEKPPFLLPEFIRRTGIQEMREALQEKEDAKTMKTKMREKVRPKMGKIDIDYQKLHDAFFKWQIKPKLTIHGDLYYEGKEFETRLKEKKPGDLSEELRIALGMPVGPNSHKVPPPWLIAMQRYGPPPSYPNLKIPGLNSPIPENCTFGYHAGGWGKPPVDEMGKPLYGDVFGTNSADFQAKAEEEEVDHTPWGELEPSDEESSEEEEEEEESDEEKPDETGFFTPADSGLITPGGFSSVPAGMETPELIELRKKKIEEAMDGNETPQLFTVLPERRTGPVGAAMMASTHIYDMSAAMAGRKAGIGDTHGVEVALAPDELELDPMAMTQKYEEHVREQQAQVEKEDFSDMVAEHAAKQKQKKRKAQPQDTRGGAKKYKEFKF